MRRFAVLFLPLLALFPLAFSCAEIAGLEGHELTGGGGAGGVGAGNSSSGSVGGGGSGGSDPEPCMMGETRRCYSGPADTDGVGVCQPGDQKCGPDGTWEAACEGEVLPVTELCVGKIDDNCDGTWQCTGDIRWARQFGATLNQFVTAAAPTPDGGYVLAGAAEGNFTFDGELSASLGAFDAIVVRLDAAGKTLWHHRFGDASIQQASSVAVRPDGTIFLAGFGMGTFSLGGDPVEATGASNSAGFVAAFSPSGDHLWTHPYATTNGTEVHGVAVGLDGEAVVVGHGNGATRKLWLDRLDGASGASLWGAPLFFTANDLVSTLTGVQVDTVGSAASGDIVIAGYGSGAIDFGAGAVSALEPGSNEIFVARFDSAGQHLWSHAYGGSGDDRKPEIAMGPSGSVYVGATTGSPTFHSLQVDAPGPAGNDVILLRIDPQGDTKFTSRLGDDSIQIFHGIAVDGAGALLFGGYYEGKITLDGAHDLTTPAGIQARFLVKLNPDLESIAWSKSLLGGALIEPFTNPVLTTDALGTVLYATPFRGKVNLGGGDFDSPSPNDSDILVGTFGP